MAFHIQRRISLKNVCLLAAVLQIALFLNGGSVDCECDCYTRSCCPPCSKGCYPTSCSPNCKCDPCCSPCSCDYGCGYPNYGCNPYPYYNCQQPPCCPRYCPQYSPCCQTSCYPRCNPRKVQFSSYDECCYPYDCCCRRVPCCKKEYCKIVSEDCLDEFLDEYDLDAGEYIVCPCPRSQLPTFYLVKYCIDPCDCGDCGSDCSCDTCDKCCKKKCCKKPCKKCCKKTCSCEDPCPPCPTT